MKAMLREVKHGELHYNCLMFVCPGCVEMVHGSGLHMLPVNSTEYHPSWDWDGNLILPTLNPSILTGKGTDKICHSYLQAGIFQFLNDCNHSLAGQKAEMPDLPDWVTNEG